MWLETLHEKSTERKERPNPNYGTYNTGYWECVLSGWSYSVAQENGQQAQTTQVVPRALYQRTFQLTSAGFSLAPTGFSPRIQQHTNNVLETSKGDAGADMTEMGFKY